MDDSSESAAEHSAPVVWLQRTAGPQYGRELYTVEVLARTPAVAEGLLSRVRALMSEHSLLRGQVVSFQQNDFDYHAPGGALTFLTRPEVAADQVILPAGQLDRIVAHVVGIGEQRDRLLAAGQHLKRGVLLYGPPGTGKTHVIRHLLARTAGTTAVLLSGRALGLLGNAARLALSEAALREAAEETDGVTASLAKELIRRVVLRAAREDRRPTDTDIADEVAAMRSDAELFTRVALGSGSRPGSAPTRSPIQTCPAGPFGGITTSSYEPRGQTPIRGHPS